MTTRTRPLDTPAKKRVAGKELKKQLRKYYSVRLHQNAVAKVEHLQELFSCAQNQIFIDAINHYYETITKNAA